MMADAAKKDGDFVGSSIHKINKLEHLEAARERLRSRLARKFPVVVPVTQATQEEPTILQMLDHHYQAAGTTSTHLEAARLRIRKRFQRKFLPQNVPPTRLNNTMLQSLMKSQEDATCMLVAAQTTDGQHSLLEPNYLPIAHPSSPEHTLWAAV